ncbi:putative surface protein with fasciclin (FAS1) repeats [Kitasatospora sp. SolWspMP-SS2h]|uniref:fasciclin domain-containing protein n=1 Tax=Kitasatospora sp. SolWspMP-SS2h TaxID=1305729 RepID=UPI000DBA0CB4|nr:fasciclin domain-containing protein [Kitasatospora sp. SolWspMP-SS2h]RAJ45455.1 putative surface protein with fasciclin (FAS1) repeats [Kitasatospora sp. SolWspMP-SS2h]
MSVTTRRRTLTALLATGALTLTLGACSSSGGSSSSSTSASAASSSAAMSSSTPSTSAMADQPFGAACAAVPKDGAGSFSGMAKDPVATAASNNPLLSTLVTAVKQAGLVDTLNSAQNITVFAPTNDAFAKIPKADLDALLADKAKLTKVLTYHVAPERLAPNALAGTHKTLEGGDLTVAGSEPDFTVNGNSKVLCGNVQTANATVYIVDTVLMPTS